MNRGLFFILFFAVASGLIFSSEPTLIFDPNKILDNTNEKNYLSCPSLLKRTNLVWNEVNVTIEYSSLDSRENIESLVEEMLNSESNDFFGRALNSAKSILVNVCPYREEVEVSTTAQIEFDGELIDDSDGGVFFSAKLNS